MNPFVNPKKRGVTLPKGCKDLIDVLKLSEHDLDKSIRRFIYLFLFQAQRDGATELVVGVASDAGTPIRYKVADSWHDVAPFPSRIRLGVISELARMANLPAEQIPGKGVLDESLGETRLRWVVAITGIEEECILTRVQD